MSDYCIAIYISCINCTSCCQIIKNFIEDFQSLKTYVNEQHQARMEKAAAALAKAQAAQPQTPDTSSTKKRGRKRKQNGQPADIPTVGPKEAFVFSESTDTGLLVTLKATLELVEFLTSKCGYKYLMTRRLNQDALEVTVNYNAMTTL